MPKRSNSAVHRFAPTQLAPTLATPVDWHNQRVIVTGGAGFLGSFVTEKLRERGAAEIIIPRRRDYDLRTPEAIQQLLADSRRVAKPVDLVIHLAANVGGIGANRARPAEFF